MNEVEAIEAVRQLINTNKTTLTTNLESQGIARTIDQVTTSVLTPATRYYFIAIYCSTPTETGLSQDRTSKLPLKKVVYPITVEVADYAEANYDEEEVFEKADKNFRILTDRIVTMLTGTGVIAYTTLDEDDEPVIGQRFVLERAVGEGNRTVSKMNTSATQVGENSNMEYLLGCKISFNLKQEVIA